MADFVDGIFLETVETQYGDIVKVSFDVDKFIEYLNDNEHVCVSQTNGRKYFNAEIKKSKSGKHYMAVDTYKPKPQKSDNPF